MSLPSHTFSYAAISAANLSNVTINGGCYAGSTVDTTVDYSNSTRNTAGYAAELTALDTFRQQTIAYLTALTPSPTYYLGANKTITPFNGTNWYIFSATTTSYPIAFYTVTVDAQSSPDAVFYIVMDDTAQYGNYLSCNFNLINGALAENIFILSTKSLVLFTTHTYYGNIIAGDVFVFKFTSDSTGDAVVNGTVATLQGDLHAVQDGSPTYKLTINSTVECFMSGTRILTDGGYVPIEKLTVGDMVVTHGSIRNKRHVMDADIPTPIVNIRKYVKKGSVKTSPIVITKNAFAPNKPFEDLYVSPRHGLIDNKGRLRPAKEFVNETTIFKFNVDEITYYHLELTSHSVVSANGVFTESFLKELAKG